MAAVEHVNDPAAFAVLRDRWDALLQESPANCIFLTWEWLYTWWKHLAGPRQLSLFVVHNGGELAAIAPLSRRPPAPRRLLPFPAREFLGAGIVGSDYLDLIVRRGSEPEALDALADALGATPLMLELAPVRRGTCFAAHLARGLGQRGWTASETTVNVCPFVSLSGHSWESYLASLRKQHRYNFRHQLDVLQQRFDVRFELARTEAERREALNALISLHTKRWRLRGGSEVFEGAARLGFYDELTQLALKRGWLKLFLLRLDGRPAAALLGFLYQRVHFFYQMGFDPDFAKYGVGQVGIGLTIRYALEEGAEECDFLRGNETYKSDWANERRELGRWDLYPPGVRGIMHRRVVGASRRIRRTVRQVLGERLTDRIAELRNHRWS